MKITVIKNNHEYKVLQEIAEELGYTVKIEKGVGAPFYPVLSFKNKKLNIASGSDSKYLKLKKDEGYIEVTNLEFIKELIINNKSTEK